MKEGTQSSGAKEVEDYVPEHILLLMEMNAHKQRVRSLLADNLMPMLRLANVALQGTPENESNTFKNNLVNNHEAAFKEMCDLLDAEAAEAIARTRRAP